MKSLVAWYLHTKKGLTPQLQPTHSAIIWGMVWCAGYLNLAHLIQIDKMDQAQWDEALILGLKGLWSLVNVNKFDGF